MSYTKCWRGIFPAARIALLLLASTAAPSQDEMQVKWNRFARAANEYVHTIDVSRNEHRQAKEKLNDLWLDLYQCGCF